MTKKRYSALTVNRYLAMFSTAVFSCDGWLFGKNIFQRGVKIKVVFVLANLRGW
jgi:hypothetical protein